MSGPLTSNAPANHPDRLQAPVLIVVNGILHNPGWANGWTDRAVTWFQTHSNWRAEKFEYFAGPLLRRLVLNRRARELAALIYSYRGRQIHLAVHSNGGEVLVRALRHIWEEHQRDADYAEPVITAAHFISAACKASFESNDLNDVLRAGLVQKVFVWIAGKDTALKLAWASEKTGNVLRALTLGLVDVGYGTLGLIGPRDVAAENEPNVHVIRRDAFGHGDWFKEPFFDWTMQMIQIPPLSTRRLTIS